MMYILNFQMFSSQKNFLTDHDVIMACWMITRGCILSCIHKRCNFEGCWPMMYVVCGSVSVMVETGLTTVHSPWGIVGKPTSDCYYHTHLLHFQTCCIYTCMHNLCINWIFLENRNQIKIIGQCHQKHMLYQCISHICPTVKFPL